MHGCRPDEPQGAASECRSSRSGSNLASVLVSPLLVPPQVLFLIFSPPFKAHSASEKGSGDRRRWTKRKAPISLQCSRAKQPSNANFPPPLEIVPAPRVACLPYYLLHHFLSRTMGKDPVCLTFAHHSPIRSFFLKTLRPAFFPKRCRQPGPEPAAEDWGDFPQWYERPRPGGSSGRCWLGAGRAALPLPPHFPGNFLLRS